MDIDKEDIDELKQFIKEQQRIEGCLTKDQIRIRRMFHPDGILIREIYKGKFFILCPIFSPSPNNSNFWLSF